MTVSGSATEKAREARQLVERKRRAWAGEFVSHYNLVTRDEALPVVDALESALDALDALSVRVQEAEAALAWIKARADRQVADGHVMVIDAIEIANKARAVLSAVPANEETTR